MGKKCQICKKKCSGDIVRADGEKYFHINCFACKTCGRSLSEAGFYVNPDGSYVCPEHVQQPQRPPSADNAQQTPKKSKKGLGLFKRGSSRDSKDYSRPLSVDSNIATLSRNSMIATSQGSPVAAATCAGCGDHLQSGQILLAMGHSWHVWCFKCAECAAVLQGEYMAYGGRPLCLRDYDRIAGVKCCECDRFIAGKVLEAGGYKFHPTCARCSRCQLPFEEGAEIYMQGNEIWHPNCEHYLTTENIAVSKSPSKGTKFQPHFGQHLTYMYMLPEAEQTYLKHPIAPNPPQPTQFHTPHGPVIKIRKSRYSMLKTGMQRLTEDLERTRPRSRSSSVDNEEPIELAHYPGAKVPDPDHVPPIDREDFPAPPYPYAVEELKRRLSSSSIENDEDEEEELLNAEGKILRQEERVQKHVKALDTIDKDSSIAYVIKQNLVEQTERKQRGGIEQQRLHWDPRNASRTPSAKKMPHLKFRYDTPINASPSRHLNRPKPWIFWKNGSGEERAATTAIPSFHLPQSRMCTMDGSGRAVTMPDGYGYYAGGGGGADTTISTHYSDHSLDMSAAVGGATASPAYLRSSLPDMSKPVKIYPLEHLQTTNKQLPEDVDRQHLERHLGRDEFDKCFGMTPIEFYKLPEWKRINLKRKHKLF
uniref:Actin-binding LIM protein 1 n=4 Tax=Meloidogyne TaxID=189290 RepID=A0A914KV38_MELIC